MILTIVVLILMLSVLILVHELGHFFVAKNRGVKVEEFGFGFPPRIFSIKRGETEYSLNAIPVGGFVKMYGEFGDARSADVNGANNGMNGESDGGQKRSFVSKKVWERAVIIIAGVTMNFILAVFLLGVGHWIGLPTILDDSNRFAAENRMVQIVEVATDSPADEAGIKMGDSITKIKNTEREIETIIVNDVGQVQEFIEDHSGEEIVLGISRGNQEMEIAVVPRVNPPEGEGAVGIAMSEVGFVSYPWYVAIWKGAESAYLILITMVIMFAGIIKTLIVGQPLPADVAGPIGIAVVSYRATQLGIVYILQFAAVISLNLVILNIFPFPALDGGRLLFLIIEKIKKSPVNQRLEGTIHQIGFAILILFMIFITFRDVVKLF